MRRVSHFLVAVLWFGATASAALAQGKQAEFDHATLARQALERHIRPGYKRLSAAMREFDGAMRAHCRRPSTRTRKRVDLKFDDAITAWGRIEHITFGPVAQDKRLERIMFWPDRRGIGARQLASTLRTRDARAIDPERLAEKSVAIQGFPALDTLLFAAADEPLGDAEARRYRCAFASAVAANLSRIAASIEREWSDPRGFSQNWLAPGPGNTLFLKPSETTLALARALDLGIERVRDIRIGGPLGLNAQRRKLTPVLAKSGRTMRLVAANIEGLRALYVEGGLEKAIRSAAAAGDPGAGARQLARLVAKELATAQKGAAELVGSKPPFDSARHTRGLIALGFPLKNARSTASSLLSEAAGLPAGFNASDGD